MGVHGGVPVQFADPPAVSLIFTPAVDFEMGSSRIMPKFMSSHTVPAGALTRAEQINQIAQAAQNDPTVQPYRSFSNLSEGTIVCIMQAPENAGLAGLPLLSDRPAVPSSNYCFSAAATSEGRRSFRLPLLTADHLNMAKLPKTSFSELHSNARILIGV